MIEKTVSGAPKKIVRIALAGNPNCGKTTLFNAITGAHHKVGNYPGVTVEKREGVRVRGERQYHFIDLPGIYSLTAYSLDEVVARDFILDEKPDMIVDVLDSTNIERNLYLCLQFQELGLPVAGALNMSDEAEARGINIDAKNLSETLGIPMVKTVGHKGTSAEDLLDLIDLTLDTDGDAVLPRSLNYREELEKQLAALEKLIAGDEAFAAQYPTRFLAVKLLEKDANAYARLSDHAKKDEITAAAKTSVDWIEKHFGKDAEIVVAEQRYGYIRGAVTESVKQEKKSAVSVTESADNIIMNRFLALPIFIFVLWAVFQLTFFLGQYPMDALELFFASLSRVLHRVIPEGLVRSLLVDGLIGGVGGVVSFIPLIVILFFFLSILEDLGYMSRAAFATDKFLHGFGLHGQSVFPMMLGFGCTVPAIMAARTLKSRKDRIITVLITPLMSCGAKLPVHVLLAAAFFPRHAANVVMMIYAAGVVLSLAAALFLRKVVLRGDPTPFVMELPPYRAPTLRGVLWHVWDKTWAYVKKAGTVILAASLIIWVITTFPLQKDDDRAASAQSETSRQGNAFGKNSGLASGAAAFTIGPADTNAADFVIKADAGGASLSALENSYAGRLGKTLEPIFRPLGFNWKLSAATITGFAAKEVIVSALSVFYGAAGEVETGGGIGLRSALASDPQMSPLIALVFMLFVLIIPPCFAALGTIKAELGWKWLAFEIVFLLVLGWLVSFAVYRAGLLIV